MNIKLGEKILITQGPTWEEAGWGPIQFPWAWLLSDGRIAARIHVDKDSCNAYGDGHSGKFFVSEDGGLSWKDAPDSAAEECGTLLPSGDRLYHFYSEPALMYSENEKWPEPVCRYEHSYSTYPYGFHYKEEIKKAVPFYRRKKGESRIVKEYAELTGWDDFVLIGLTSDQDFGIERTNKRWLSITRPFIYGRLRVAPDGSLWATHYNGAPLKSAAEEDKYVMPSHAFYLRSDDNGKSFRLISSIEYKAPLVRGKVDERGFNENDIAFMPDGSIITLIRSSNGYDRYLSFARSEDNGKSWSTPECFAHSFAWPTLCSLKCGVTLASYGRPGIYIVKTEDKSGLIWDEPIEIMNTSGCGYAELIAVGDNEAMIFYTDFNYPDSAGIKRKSLFAQKITLTAT